MVVNMIENVYPIRESKTPGTGRSRKLPRNIRACGQGGGPFPVYIEDYVETYIRKLTESGFPECSAVVLVGQVMETETGRCLFVRGGVNANAVCAGDRPVFNEEVWNDVYEKIRLHFPKDEVVGWCIAGPGFRLLQEDVFLRAHIDNFADSEKLFLCYESLEKELTLRICKGGTFCILPGYYIYYEKNDEMQNYMLEEASLARKERKSEDMQTVSGEVYAEEKQKNPGQKNEKGKASTEDNISSAKKDILQLAAIACVIVLIVSVMMKTDALSLLKESTFADGTKQEENQTTFEAQNEIEKPEEFAFGDFDFLDNEEVLHETAKKEEVSQENIKQDEETPKKDTEGEEVKTQEPERRDEEQNALDDADTSGQAAETNTENPEENEVGTKESPDVIEEETVTVLSPSEYTGYVVKAGDTLAGICMEVYGSVELLHYICELNQLKNIDSIYAGQELILPK